MPTNEPTPVTDATHLYVAQRMAAFCAAWVDANYDQNKTPAINTDGLVDAACKQFGITGRDRQETYEIRETYIVLLENANG